MLNNDDRNFLVQVMDKGKYEGMQACFKACEVFLKLQEEMKNEQAGVAEADTGHAGDASEEEMVPEPDHVGELGDDPNRFARPTAHVTGGDTGDGVCSTVRNSGDVERDPKNAD